MCEPYNTEEKIHACILKHNSTLENQVIFLVITNVKKGVISGSNKTYVLC